MERKPYKRYSREFKLEAVRLAAVDGRPKAQIARQLGIRVNQLRKWRQEFERENARPNASSPPLATDDVEQMRREIARLRIENEILKKRRRSTSRGHCCEVQRFVEDNRHRYEVKLLCEVLQVSRSG
jgi:transposase